MCTVEDEDPEGDPGQSASREERLHGLRQARGEVVPAGEGGRRGVLRMGEEGMQRDLESGTKAVHVMAEQCECCTGNRGREHQQEIDGGDLAASGDGAPTNSGDAYSVPCTERRDYSECCLYILIHDDEHTEWR